MAIFLDTGDIEEIRKFHSMGIIRGVTTNPTILRKCGFTGDMKEIKKLSIEIAQLIHPYPLTVEVTSNEPKIMIKQAKDIGTWADNMAVKITVHGPNGELDNLRIVHELETKHNIRINVTAMMSAQQCFLSAMAGATYVSLFGGRVNDMGYNAIEEIKKIRKLLDDFKLSSQVIVASTRETLNVLEWLYAGAHIVTVLPHFLERMIIHPYTKETVQMFLKDAAKMEKGL